jgi:hypothetical protein
MPLYEAFMDAQTEIPREIKEGGYESFLLLFI